MALRMAILKSHSTMPGDMMTGFTKTFVTGVLICLSVFVQAQLKYLVDDFEGYSAGSSDIGIEGLYGYGGISIEAKPVSGAYPNYIQETAIHVKWDKHIWHGGWGKKTDRYIQLDAGTDFLNFYVLNQPVNNSVLNLTIKLQDDDDLNGYFDFEKDDLWKRNVTVVVSDSWQLISIPLKEFQDSNQGGDGELNLGYSHGKLLNMVIEINDFHLLKNAKGWMFDFLCFSKGVLPVHDNQKTREPVKSSDHCLLGVWSKEDEGINYKAIGSNFEKNQGIPIREKLAVISFYKAFAIDGSNMPNLFFSENGMKELLNAGYTPMITIENQFHFNGDTAKQPNLYAITEGHFDYFFADWARRIKSLNKPVLVRILHEFNGDWFPWSVARNDQNPLLIIEAYRRIHGIFKSEKADNALFVWCPNSVSTPQAHWNNPLDAYPGNDVVDFTGIDVFNGAGGMREWRSFRQEATEMYAMLTMNFPEKPLIICEVSSRERTNSEKGSRQDKARWISQFAEALQTDMTKIKMIVWFHENEFKTNTSNKSELSFRKSIWSNPYFSGNILHLLNLIK
jgi:hypothetical protein